MSDLYDEWQEREKIISIYAEKCERLEKQLAIAVEALKRYADRSKWFDFCVLDDGYIDGESSVFVEDGYYFAEKALKQIKDLDKTN